MRPSSSLGLHRETPESPSCIFTIKRSINVEINRNVTWAFYYSQHSSSSRQATENQLWTHRTSSSKQHRSKMMTWKRWNEIGRNRSSITIIRQQKKGSQRDLRLEKTTPVRGDRVQPIQARFRFNFPPQIGFMRQRRYPMIWKIKLKFEK